METVARAVRAQVREHQFFTVMALLITATVVGGFGQFALRGFVNVATTPFWVHLHGAVMMSWTLLYLTQNILILRGVQAVHRQIGWVTACVGAALVPLGLATAALAVTFHRVPPFFTPEIFLALSILEVTAFAVLLTAALVRRRRSDWHKRLMLCAMLSLIGPAFGRILPMPLLGDFGGLAVLGSQMLYLAIALGYELSSRGRVHPAYLVGGAIILVEGLAVPLLAGSASVIALTAALPG